MQISKNGTKKIKLYYNKKGSEGPDLKKGDKI